MVRMVWRERAREREKREERRENRKKRKRKTDCIRWAGFAVGWLLGCLVGRCLKCCAQRGEGENWCGISPYCCLISPSPTHDITKQRAKRTSCLKFDMRVLSKVFSFSFSFSFLSDLDFRMRVSVFANM